MSLICLTCKMLTEPMGLTCEFCGGNVRGDIILLGQYVPGYGKISSVKMGEMEREYLCTMGRKNPVVSWCSQSDIETQMKLNNREIKYYRLSNVQ